LLASTALLAAASADARSIRVDPGGGSWEQNFDNVLDAPGDTGEVRLPFSFLGSDSLFISASGELRNGSDDSFLRPLSLGSAPTTRFITFDWGGKDRDCATAPALCAPDGERQAYDAPLLDTVPIDTDETVFAGDAFRVTWFSRNANDEDSLFQVVVWRLLNDDFVIEFNYDELAWGLDGSSLGFLVRDPADVGNTPFEFEASEADYGVTFINLFDCQGFEGCAEGDNFIWDGFPAGELLDAFLAPAFGEQITGRALFYIDAGGAVDVDEPGTLALALLGGLGLLGFVRRRKQRATTAQR
jgi:MYXO-CTERM domain-containing protein